MLQKLHYVAYRWRDAAETVEFYTKVIGMKFAHAIANDHVPSTKAYSPHIHIFFEMAGGSFIAFFELPKSPPAQLPLSRVLERAAAFHGASTNKEGMNAFREKRKPNFSGR